MSGSSAGKTLYRPRSRRPRPLRERTGPDAPTRGRSSSRAAPVETARPARSLLSVVVAASFAFGLFNPVISDMAAAIHGSGDGPSLDCEVTHTTALAGVRAISLDADATGNAYIAFHDDATSGPGNAEVRKYDPTCQLGWSRTFLDECVPSPASCRNTGGNNGVLRTTADALSVPLVSFNAANTEGLARFLLLDLTTGATKARSVDFRPLVPTPSNAGIEQAEPVVVAAGSPTWVVTTGASNDRVYGVAGDLTTVLWTLNVKQPERVRWIPDTVFAALVSDRNPNPSTRQLYKIDVDTGANVAGVTIDRNHAASDIPPYREWIEPASVSWAHGRVQAGLSEPVARPITLASWTEVAQADFAFGSIVEGGNKYSTNAFWYEIDGVDNYLFCGTVQTSPAKAFVAHYKRGATPEMYWNATFAKGSGTSTDAFHCAFDRVGGFWLYGTWTNPTTGKQAWFLRHYSGGGFVTHPRPSAPTNLGATPGPSSISLEWDPPVDLGGRALLAYRVYRKAPATESWTALARTNSAAYADLGLAPSTTYQYKVTAETVAGEGADSNILSASTFLVGGQMSLEGRPSCYAGHEFVVPVTSHCNPDPFGFTDSITAPNSDAPSFVIDWGDFNRHEDVRCGSAECTFEFDFDLSVLGPSSDLTAFDGQKVDVAQLERFESSSSSWVAVPNGLVQATVVAPSASTWSLALPQNLSLTAEAIDTKSGSAMFRLVAADRPGLSGEAWGLSLHAAKAQLVASPVVFLHGWPPFPDRLQSEYNEEAAIWAGEFATELEEAGTVAFGQNPWAWAGETGFVTLAYDGKEDFRTSFLVLSNAIQGLRPQAGGLEPGAGYLGPVSIVAHSFGGLVARFLVEKRLPELEQEHGAAYDPQAWVSEIIAIGTPHLGSKWGTQYTKAVDARDSWMRHEHYYVDVNGEAIYRNTFTFNSYVHGEWWREDIGAFRNWEQYGDNSPEFQQMEADFEVGPVDGQNPPLANLDARYGTSGIPYFLIAGDYTLDGGPIGPLQPLPVPGDGIVGLYSATRNAAETSCFQVYTDSPDHAAQRDWRLVDNARHDHLHDQLQIQQDALSFLSGDKIGPCRNQPNLVASQTLTAVPSSSSNPALPETLLEVPVRLEFTATAEVTSWRFDWVAPGQSNGTLFAYGVNETMTSLNATLRSPTGEVAWLSTGNTSWVNWTGPNVFGGDATFLVTLPKAGPGNWTLWLNVTAPGDGLIVPSAAFDTALRVVVQEGSEGLVHQPVAYRATLVNGTSPVLDADVELLLDDPSGGGFQVLLLVDDGTGVDLTANDGIYSGQHTFAQAGVYGFQVNATTGSAALTHAGATAILNSPDDAELSCGQALLSADEALVRSMLERNPTFVVHCLLDGDPAALGASGIALLKRHANGVLP